MCSFANSSSLPFIIIGDFNELSSSADKLGGAPFHVNRIARFLSICSAASAIELPFVGQEFTWRKKRSGTNNVLERLDKAIVSLGWLELFSNASIVNHVFTSSDHSPISLSLPMVKVSKAPPFRFQKMWCLRKDFDCLVKKTWCTKFHGSHMYCLVQKCKLLKSKAKEWNKYKFGNIFRQVKVVDDSLSIIQSNLNLDPSNIRLISRQEALLTKRRKLFEFQSSFWKQKSKEKFWEEGDANTAYFHASASIRRNRNQIKSFCTSSGVWSSNPLQIALDITAEFTARFTSNSSCGFDLDSDFSLIDSIISEDDNSFLIRPVLDDEIKAAVFDLAPDKTPGPDGFPPFFFQKYWSLVGNSVSKAVKAFFFSGKMLKEINHTFITLIPKVENPSSANHFRPISLCSSIYKVIAKIMANRLKICLGKLIHPFQGAFVPDRIIQDNILIAHEIFHSFKNKGGQSGWLAIKLDMEKAYDRLEWSFILAMLQKFGFHPQWIGWIEQCLVSVSFAVLVNGVPGDLFVPSRGIRQGDPLSPYLFILCAELLARSLQAQSSAPNKLIGIKVGRAGPRIPFLTFADDTMIFAQATQESCIAIKGVLDQYCHISGQLVNFHKSSFQCSKNVPEEAFLVFQDILSMSHSLCLGKYLGCPLISERVTKSTFSEVVESSMLQLSKWKANSLSHAGRAVLVQSNLAAKPSFMMQSFSLPGGVLHDLDKINRNFLWNKSPDCRSANLIGWDRVCQPKCFGGLGIRKASINNIALQMKLLWRLISDPENNWVSLVSKKYLKSKSI